MQGTITRIHLQEKTRSKENKLARFHWLTRPMLAFAVTRFIVFIGGYLGEVSIQDVIGDSVNRFNANNIFFDIWARWDSGWYISIIQTGYWFDPSQQSNVPFFPLYPLLVNILRPVFGDLLIAGVVVSNLFLLGALIFLYKLTELEFDKDSAGRAVFYIAAFPTAFFFSAIYTESTFLFFTVSTMYFARKRMWAWAALFGVLCASSRIVGVVIWGVVGLEWLRLHGWTLSTIYMRESWHNVMKAIRTDWFNLLLICLIPLGLISYMLFLNSQFDDPVAFFTAQKNWSRENLGPIAIISRDLGKFFSGDFATGSIRWRIPIDVTSYLFIVGISIAVWRRLGASYGLYCLISILIPSMSGTGSLSRYSLVVFPVFMMLGHWGQRQWVDRSVLVIFSVLLGILTTLFVNWIFVA